MASDVKLDGDWVVAEGTVRIAGTDLMLDHPYRRKAGGDYRRALVHGFDDDLVVNYANDYPNGVKLVGSVELPAVVRLPAVVAPAVTDEAEEGAPGPTEVQAVTRPGSATISAAALRASMLQTEPDLVKLFENAENPVELNRELRRIRRAILSLDRRLRAVEKR